MQHVRWTRQADRLKLSDCKVLSSGDFIPVQLLNHALMFNTQSTNLDADKAELQGRRLAVCSELSPNQDLPQQISHML